MKESDSITPDMLIKLDKGVDENGYPVTVAYYQIGNDKLVQVTYEQNGEVKFASLQPGEFSELLPHAKLSVERALTAVFRHKKSVEKRRIVYQK